MKKLEKPVQMAVIGAPHGVRGEVRVKTFTGDPEALGDYGPLVAEDGRTLTVASIRPAKNVMVVRFKEITSREAAEAATGLSLFIERAALPEIEDEEEFYHTDLVGLAIRDETGATVGKVTSIQNFGGGDILVATISGRRDIMIPFTLAAIPEVSVSQGFVRIDSVAAGLVDDEDEEESR